jgi:peptide/nickel transport system permease protein
MLILKKFARDIPALIGLVIVASAVLIAIVGPWIAPYPGDIVASHLLQRLKAPSAAFPFGTDNLGRDLFSRVILGTRGALEVAVIVVVLASAIRVPLGLIAGYASGWLSEVIMRITDVFLALPQLVLALALAQLLTPSLESAMIALALTYWPFFTRLVYAETRRLQASLFVDALRGIGAGSGHHLFPHPAQRDFSGYRAGDDRHGLHDPRRRRPRISGNGGHPACPRLGSHHLGKPQLSTRRLVVRDLPRVGDPGDCAWLQSAGRRTA